MLNFKTPRAAVFSVLLGVAATSIAQAQPGDQGHNHRAASVAGVPLYDNLGSHHFEVSTGDPLAQRYFDQGLRLYYAFNHAEAIRAFEEGLRIDPSCAMCAWGIALSLGPNINAAMESAAVPRAFAESRKAVSLSQHATPLERDLIEALAVRYVSDPMANRAPLDSAYARSMGEVVRKHPASTEAAVLYAEALMDLRPWQYWTADGEPQPGVPELLTHLERAIAVNPEHPGACHFFIHAVEAVQPERAVPCAERLADLMPGAGHLVHMPGHIYVRVGRYADAIRANEHAVHADETYIQDQRPGVGVYTAGYYPHNYDFLAFAASMAGRSNQAIAAAEKIVELVPEEMLLSGELPFLQQFIMRPLQQRVRFGRWDEILRSPAPPTDLTYSTALWHYGRGVAFVAEGDLSSAQEELAQLRSAAEGPELADMNLEFNSAQAILRIATGVLEGRVAAAQGDNGRALQALQAAVAEEDALVYGEPPEWSVPARHDLGAFLLEADRPEDAEQVFLRDLEKHPENGWALYGLMQSILAQGRNDDAAAVRERFEKAWSEADVQISSARF